MKPTSHTRAVARAILETPTLAVWGYDLHRRSGVPSGRLYPLLSRMVDQGWLTAYHADDTAGSYTPPRRYYRLTSEGRTALTELASR